MMRKQEKQYVMMGINITHQIINLGNHIVSQVHILPEKIREGLGWMSYREK
jgi:hypothetical protein